MNMPKRASRHHLIRRSRSSTVEVVGPRVLAIWAFVGCAEKDVETAAAPAARKRRRLEMESCFIVKATSSSASSETPVSPRRSRDFAERCLRMYDRGHAERHGR